MNAELTYENAELSPSGDELACEMLNSFELEAAVASVFAGVPGRIDLRFLWRCGETVYARINWWRRRPDRPEYYIERSEFVALERRPDGWAARPAYRQHAA